MERKRTIELLAPAKDLATARAAIDHGADAIYIGGPDFSARVAAGNTVADIASLVQYARLFRVRVYVTLNTLLTDDELPAARDLICRLYEAGTDALIVQDMALLEMDLPPVELHASTQAHIDTPSKAEFLHRAGFTRVVAARETSLDTLAEMARIPGLELEAFVHGALCVSYSGQCYMSRAFTSRSANRGNCSQICRLPFDVFDARARLLRSATHILSLKDLNRSDSLEDLIDAGVHSLKIEGRLKDTAYVKNTTAYYRQALDRILARRPDLARSSDGTARIGFTPDPARTFNRGFTDYLLSGRRQEDIANPATPKSVGQPAGKVLSVAGGSITTDSPLTFSAGDGFIYLRADGTSGGFQINRADGQRLFPFKMPAVKPGDRLFRNADAAFARTLAGKTAERKVGLDLLFSETPGGYSLHARDESGFEASAEIPAGHTDARTEQKKRIADTLARLGDTEFKARNIVLEIPSERFIPMSAVADLRRRTIETLRDKRAYDHAARRHTKTHEHPPLPPGTDTDYRLNVANHLSRTFYARCGVAAVSPAYEEKKVPEAQLALCRHCIKYSLGLCPRYGGKNAPDTQYLVLVNGNVRMRADFDCAACRMSLSEMR